jgi:hypothetical protein
VLFHVWLGFQIHVMPGVAPGHRALMETLNAAGTLMVLFFTVGSLACARDVLATRLGRLFLGFVLALYLSRAAEEIVVATPFPALIFGVCLLIAALKLVLLVRPAAKLSEGLAAR